ncbi:DUF2933 domain-containing protein [Niallia sp. Sow4_A1]|uniref:DUF2933 domain-containing protein n=1 Tax=unclassified Niallia TaxID=2837522 RepID=UPI003F8A5E6D
MEWLPFLLLLACPLMMIFCMKGHGSHGGHGKGHNHDAHCSNDLESKMSKLELENEKLRKEIDSLSAMVKKES